MTDLPYFFPPDSPQTSPAYPVLIIPIVIFLLLTFYAGIIAVIMLVKKLLPFNNACHCKGEFIKQSFPSCLERMRYLAERCNINIPSPSNLIDERCRAIIATCQCGGYLRSIFYAMKEFKDSIVNFCQCCNNCNMCHCPECNCTCTKPECNEINCGCFSINFKQ